MSTENLNIPSPETGRLADDAQTLLNATANIAEEKVVAARNRLTKALQNGKEFLGKAQEQVVAGAKATDKTIREHPYEAIGVAVGVGALLGFLLARRNN
jgi:ElaB/YqjD/DUF883 family membrane-anchored ribosome-binding protein